MLRIDAFRLASCTLTIFASFLVHTAAGALAPTTQSAALYKSQPGPWTVAVRDENWTDTRRNRLVPVQIYSPVRSGDLARRPVIIFSHGWGGSRTSYRYFAEHLASWGYLVISPTHVGSDSAAVTPRLPTASHMSMAGIRDLLLHGVNEPDNLRDRPRDISFVIDQIARGVPLGAAVDLDHIGVAGHSFGAYTAMAVGGMLVDLPEGKRQSLRDARVKAVLAMSPEGTGWMGISPGAWSRFAVPAMFLTGTRDFGGSGRPATWRHEPFNAISTVPEWQVTILYATHMTFVSPGIDERIIDSLGTAFFDASLLHDRRASAWTTGFFSTKHGDCLVDHRTPTP